MQTILLFLAVAAGADQRADEKTTTSPPLRPIVEVEEDVYSFEPANNGAGPMWCSGSTCLVRIGEDVFASGLETLKGAKPLNNCRWTLFRRASEGWQRQQIDPNGRTREPCPLVTLAGGKLLLSANPTLVADRNTYSGPARTEILLFSTKEPKSPFETILPSWDGQPEFTEHSYRSSWSWVRRRPAARRSRCRSSIPSGNTSRPRFGRGRRLQQPWTCWDIGSGRRTP